MKKHILLVDDDADEVLIFTGALDQLHIPYKCTWAKSGEQAVSQLAYLTPDIIFLDLNMPGMDGLECLAVIKRMSQLEGVPVVLQSSVLSEECRARAMELGAWACLEKTGTMAGLSELLGRLMGVEYPERV